MIRTKTKLSVFKRRGPLLPTTTPHRTFAGPVYLVTPEGPPVSERVKTLFLILVMTGVKNPSFC